MEKSLLINFSNKEEILVEIRLYLELNDKKWCLYHYLWDAVNVICQGKVSLSSLLFHLHSRILDGRENEKVRATMRTFIAHILKWKSKKNNDGDIYLQK